MVRKQNPLHVSCNFLLSLCMFRVLVVKVRMPIGRIGKSILKIIQIFETEYPRKYVKESVFFLNFIRCVYQRYGYQIKIFSASSKSVLIMN